MKTILALALATFSLAACAAPASNDSAEATSDLAAAAPALDPATTVYRGGFDAMGSHFSLEVELTSKQIVKQTKYCDPGGEGQDAFAGSSASPNYDDLSSGGTIRTIVRDAYGTIIGEASDRISSFSAYTFDQDVATQCKKGGRLVANFAPTTTFTYAHPLIWIPGVIAHTAEGDLWINPSYGGVGREFRSFEGTASYESLSNATLLRPRPFDGEGQELVFDKGELTFKAGTNSFSLEVGTEIDPSGSHAHVRTSISLTR